MKAERRNFRSAKFDSEKGEKPEEENFSSDFPRPVMLKVSSRKETSESGYEIVRA